MSDKFRRLLRHLVLGIAIANILHLTAWAELFAASQTQSYYLRLSRADFIAVPLTVLALGAFLGAVAAAGAHLGRRRPRVVRAFAVAPMVLGPFVVVTFVRALWSAATIDIESRFADTAPPLSAIPAAGAPGPQVVVLLFDAMGQAVTFDKRPAGVEMPAFDRLMAGSIAGKNVRKAATRTVTSVPSFLSGMKVLSAKPSGPSELTIGLPDGTHESWAELPNVFRDARELGGTAIIAGWYHPYCRVLTKDLDACSWYPTANSGGRAEEGFLASLGWSLRSANRLLVYRDRHARTQIPMMRDARVALAHKGAGITFVHIAASHFPLIYDRHSGRTTLVNFSRRGHEDMLALADRTLAELREHMEAAGTWDDSTVIVTADHPAGFANRAEKIKGDHRVPYLLKMPHQSEGRGWERPVSATQLGRPLIRAVLAGEVRTDADAMAWLEAVPAPSP